MTYWERRSAAIMHLAEGRAPLAADTSAQCDICTTSHLAHGPRQLPSKGLASGSSGAIELSLLRYSMFEPNPAGSSK